MEEKLLYAGGINDNAGDAANKQAVKMQMFDFHACLPRIYAAGSCLFNHLEELFAESSIVELQQLRVGHPLWRNRRLLYRHLQARQCGSMARMYRMGDYDLLGARSEQVAFGGGGGGGGGEGWGGGGGGGGFFLGGGGGG